MASYRKLHLVPPAAPAAAKGADVRPHKADRVPLSRDATAEEAYRATLLNCADHIARNIGAIIAGNHEGVHQARVGLRRLRVALTSFGDAFRTRGSEELSQRAKLLAQALGIARELDVFAADMLPEVEEDAPDLAGVDALKLALEEARARARTEAAALARSPLLSDFLRRVEDYAESRAWRDGAAGERRAAFVAAAMMRATTTLDERLAKARKRARDLVSLNEKERHKLRIALKKLRYSAEFFAPLFKRKRTESFIACLSGLQDRFGAMNDAVSVGGVLDHVVEGAPPSLDRAALRACAAFVHGWHRARVKRLWKKARKGWRAFAEREPFWH